MIDLKTLGRHSQDKLMIDPKKTKNKNFRNKKESQFDPLVIKAVELVKQLNIGKPSDKLHISQR
tara:strand:+ start:443 stop:634 length:192 start_codon:yes stop_codon:yes gene_type:complete